MNAFFFMPSNPDRCKGCMYNTFLGCNAPQEYRETCPNKEAKR